ncbi:MULTISPECIES: hypothetical protein [Sphingomonas]|jgi:hypothetical protein|uniref:Uncharacterized protein n=1 Tax=Sphingomonas leidyi TaxID=68569 RepID=A0A7X5UYZ1_9SPHN|nr:MULTISPECIES: hypothetical protein [Sphingomonas]MBN8813051.1 hypothetical protein [Sphingomonas sp.]NIJ64804.1 hypothetical protein [Sphingomonas leidyi]
MSSQNDREYLEYRQRLSAEKARTTVDPGVARVHDAFARAYARRLHQQVSTLTE